MRRNWCVWVSPKPIVVSVIHSIDPKRIRTQAWKRKISHDLDPMLESFLLPDAIKSFLKSSRNCLLSTLTRCEFWRRQVSLAWNQDKWRGKITGKMQVLEIFFIPTGHSNFFWDPKLYPLSPRQNKFRKENRKVFFYRTSSAVLFVFARWTMNPSITNQMRIQATAVFALNLRRIARILFFHFINWN